MGANFRPDIEGLRGLAVLLVVVFHAGLALPGGFIGVDVFFVISGFLITGLLLRERERTGRIDFAAFYARRVRRLLPAAIVVLLVTLPIAFVLFTPLDRGEMVMDGAAAALSLGNFRFAMAAGDYFTTIATPSPFLHFWSLAVEEQFYLVWPALVLVAARTSMLRTGIGLAIFNVFLASLFACFVLTDIAPSWAFYSLPTRAFELAAGGLLAVALPLVARVPSWILGPAGWAGLAMIVWSAFAFDAAMAFPGTAALVPTLGTVALICAGLRVPARLGAHFWLTPAGVMSLSPIRFVGRISYSLYLVHWPLFVLAGIYFGFGLTPGLVEGAALIAASVGLATLSWALVEQPFRRGFSPRLRLPSLHLRPRATLATGLAGMLSVVLVANGLAIAAQRDLDELRNGGQPAAWAGPSDWSGAENDPDITGPTAEGEDIFDDEPIEELSEVFIPGDDYDDSTPAPVVLPPDENRVHTPRPHSNATPTPAPTRKPQASTPKPQTATPKPKPAPTPVPAAKRTPQPTPSDWALPADVQPPVANARQDKEKPWFDRCLGIEASVKPRAACVYGDPNGSYTLALVGDSHGSAMFPAMEWVAKKNGWRLLVYVKVACPFMDIPVRSLVLKREYTECAQWNEEIISRLNAASPNLTVVHMSHWIFPVQSGLRASDYSASMARMIKRLKGKTVILADTPNSSMDVPSCLSQYPWDIRNCSTPRARALSGHGVIEKRAAEAARVALIDIAGHICVGKPCQAVVDNMIVYRDRHHLTATFARSLGPELNRLIQMVK